LDFLFEEAARLLKPGGRIFIETPHLKTVVLPSLPGAWAGTFPMSFYDDLITHTKPVATGVLAHAARRAGFKIVSSGTSRNWLLRGATFFPFWRHLPDKNTPPNFIIWAGRRILSLNACNRLDSERNKLVPSSLERVFF
jgi:hypothetical protein